jgi:8-oxo-dGTP pyrophosphatase MutT (NUDIX family)
MCNNFIENLPKISNATFDVHPSIEKFHNLLDKYQIALGTFLNSDTAEQNKIIEQFKSFSFEFPKCFERENKTGHITGSAFVINPSFTKVLLTYHAKLHLWLQLGGHADGDFCIQNVALKEAQEESGIENFSFFNLETRMFESTEIITKFIPFDLDIHLIPERKDEPAHEHYDVRFILMAHNEDFIISSESLDLRWISLDEVHKYTKETSTLRQVNKCKEIRKLFLQ